MHYKVWLFTCLTLVACKKPEDRTCFKGVGSQSQKEILLESFNRMELKEHVEYELIQDSLDKVVLIGGKNLLNLIDVTVTDGSLKIQNRNRCTFLRNAKKVVKAEIHFTSLININFVGTEPLRSRGTINTDYFTFYSRDGAGDVVLDLKAIHIDSEADHGWCNYTFTGSTKTARICAKSNSYCDVSGLHIEDSVYVASETEGDIKLDASNIPLVGYLKEKGNIYYKGTPTVITIVQTGKGSVLPL